MHQVGAIILIALLVIGVIYVYNAFIAAPGASIATLGVKAAS